MGNDTRRIDEAIDRLVAANRAAGFAPVTPPSTIDAVLAEIREAIAPLRLPVELERFWRRVDPHTLTVSPYPRLTDPTFALHCWRSHRDQPGMVPGLLFPISYESHNFLLVELEDDRGSGGVVVEWAYAGGRYQVRFPSLAALVDLFATMIELDEVERHRDGDRSWVSFDPDGRWEDALTVRLSAAQPLPGFGHVRELGDDVLAWPEHWQRSDGLTPDSRALRGATTTIADLLRRAAGGTAAQGTVRGSVASLAGTSGGIRAAIDDGTGVLDVWCPSAVCTYGPAVGHDFELDVVMRPHPSPPPDWRPEHRDIQDHALAHDLAGAQAAAMELHAKAFGTPAAAEATAIRRVG